MLKSTHGLSRNSLGNLIMRSKELSILVSYFFIPICKPNYLPKTYSKLLGAVEGGSGNPVLLHLNQSPKGNSSKEQYYCQLQKKENT